MATRQPLRNTATYNDVRIVNNVVDQIGGVGIGTDIDDLVNAHDFTGTHRENAMTNLYVAHNWIGNTGRNTVIARDSDYAVYEYNTSANSSRHSTGHSFFNFRTLGMTFQYNEAYGNVGEGNQVDRGGFDADYNSKDTTIQYNYSHNNDWFVGVMKRPNTDVTIRYNLSVNDKKGAFHYGFENFSDVENVDTYNNTVYFGAGITPEVVPLSRTPHETTFNNNILYAVDQGTMGLGADNGTNVTYDTNAYYNITPPASEINPLTQDPLFFSPGAEPHDVDMQFGRDVLAGYKLTSNSPFLNSGVAVANNGGLDFWGNPVPNGGADVGAAQFNGLVISTGATVYASTPFPDSSTASIIAATPDQATFGDDAAASLTQTFQVESALELQTIFLGYEYDPAADPASILINIELFEVADVTSSTLVQGSSLLTLNGLSLPDLTADNEAAIVLDSVLSLDESSGASGYGIRITGGGNPGFEWQRTGSGSGSVYDLGKAYEDGVEKLNGERDFVLALSDLDISLPDNADFDANGTVDGIDFLTWQRGSGATSGADSTDGDADNDGDVDADDLLVWQNQHGSQSSLAGGHAVPEPSSYLVCLLGLLSLCLSRRFSRLDNQLDS